MDDPIESASDIEDRRRKKLEQLKARHAKRAEPKVLNPKVDLDSISANLSEKAINLLESNRLEESKSLIKEIENFLTSNDSTGLKFKSLRNNLEKLRQKIVTLNASKGFSFGVKPKKKETANLSENKEPKTNMRPSAPLSISSKDIITLENLVTIFYIIDVF